MPPSSCSVYHNFSWEPNLGFRRVRFLPTLPEHITIQRPGDSDALRPAFRLAAIVFISWSVCG